MFGDVNPTPYDLKFKLLGVPVRVHPLFWLITLALGMDSTGGMGDFKIGLLWVAAVFVSILWHEFGHVLMARACHWGVDEVVLYQFGGYAALRPPYGKRLVVNDILISLAGPCAGFLLYGILDLTKAYSPQALMELGDTGWIFFMLLILINFYLNIFNLLPIFPLDGGKALRSFLVAVAPGGGPAAAFISIITAAGMAMYMFRQQNGWTAFMMISLLVMNIPLLQQRH